MKERISKRVHAEQAGFTASMKDVWEALLGKNTVLGSAYSDKIDETHTALDAVLNYYQVADETYDDKTDDLAEHLDRRLQSSGMMWRSANLSKGWYKDAAGAMLGRKKNGTPVALIPRSISGYNVFDASTGALERVTRRNMEDICPEVICFYRPLPLRKLSLRDLGVFLLGTLEKSDFLFAALITLLLTLVSLLIGVVNQIVFEDVVGVDVSLLVPVMTMYLGVALATVLLNMSRSLILSRITDKVSQFADAAAVMRVLSMPASFLRRYSAGDMSARLSQLKTICVSLINIVVNTGFSCIFSLLYLSQIFIISPALFPMTAGLILVSAVLSVLYTVGHYRLEQRKLTMQAQLSGLVYALYTGIQKLRLAGAEQRAFSKWARLYAKAVKAEYNPPTAMKLESTISLALSLFGAIILYYIAVRSSVTPADFIAFTIIYGMAMGTVSSLTDTVEMLVQMRSGLEQVKPILETMPESTGEKPYVKDITGEIVMEGVSFRYGEESPDILRDLSLRITPGEYVAIVGKTGCGKSTLVKLLLGFERPHRGSIFYDERNLLNVDIRSLRRKIGSVLQDDALLSGTIFDNIAATASILTVEEAWAAAEVAGIAEDIAAMPMGMHTLVSEDSKLISGGQKQRILIARAIAAKPRVLILDEATSALDNTVQKRISTALAALNCTRIVVAHRLSTIVESDRILLLEDGRIAEDGTYDELIRREGLFSSLVRRQQINTAD